MPLQVYAPTTDNFRQLRHQTKNALQRLLCTIHTAPELRGDGNGALRDRLQRRIMVTAQLSDALFGFTRAPGDLRDRLHRLAHNLVELLADEPEFIFLTVHAETDCSASQHDALVRIAHELVGNALKHGLRQRRLGSIEIRLHGTDTQTTLSVIDDGVGYGPAKPDPGEGLSLVDLLLQPHDGSFQLARHADHTVATATLRKA